MPHYCQNALIMESGIPCVKLMLLQSENMSRSPGNYDSSSLIHLNGELKENVTSLEQRVELLKDRLI